MIADTLSEERTFDTSTADLIRYRNQLKEVGVRVLSATESDAS